MKIHYIVTRPFAGHKRGDIINDPAEIATLKRGPYQHSVVRAIERPEHASGDFWKSDEELASKGKPTKVVPQPVEK